MHIDTADYNQLDLVDLSVDLDLEVGGDFQLLDALIAGKPTSKIDPSLLKETIKHHTFSEKDFQECVRLVQEELGIVINQSDL